MANHNGNRQPATPQEIWDILHALSESQAETDRRMQETDRRMQETDQLLKRQARDADRRFRKLDDLFNGQWGKLMESLVEGDLVKLLNERGIHVEHTTTRLKDPASVPRWEFDIVAVNGDQVVVVEVKTTLQVRDVTDFIDALNAFPELVKEYGSRQVYGAVAYLKADKSSTVYAERQGLYVIRATGSSASITNAADFTPRRYGRLSAGHQPH